MVTGTDVRREAKLSTFTEAKALQENGNVYSLNCDIYKEDGYDITLVRGSVKEWYGRDYRTTVEIDEDYSEILSSQCSCLNDKHSHDLLCKHCAATLLEYIMERENCFGWNGFEKSGKIPTIHRTTEGFRELMEHYIAQNTLPILQDNLQGTVRLEPILKVGHGTISVEFKIGTSHMYVLKDIIQFVEAMRNAALVSYGKKLEFYHHLGAFNEQSKPIVEFLMKETEIYLNSRNDFNYYYNRVRTMDLAAEDLEHFIAAMGEQEFDLELMGDSIRKYHVENANPKRIIKLCGKEEGLEFSITKYIGFCYPNYYYYFDGGVVYQVKREEFKEVEAFLKWLGQTDDFSGYIANVDLPLFCRDLLPILEKYFPCTKENFEEELYLPISAEFEIYLDAPQKDMITCKLLVIYGEEKYNVFEETAPTENRDVKKEIETGRLVSEFFNAYDDEAHLMVLSEDEDRIYFFLAEAIPKLQTIGQVYISEALKSMKVVPAPKVTVGVSLSGDLLELTLSVGEMPLEQLIGILSKYDKRKKFYRLKNGDFMNVDEDGIAILSELKSGLNLSDSQLRKGVVEIPKYRALYLDAQLKDKQALPVLKNKDFKSLVRNMKTIEDNDFEIPASLEPILREYQKRGYMWIKTLHSNGFCGILADDMGLGKTIQVICFLLSEYLEGKPEDNRSCLIVCPASLVYNWKIEIERFAKKLPVKMVVGSAEERKRIVEELSARDILITSYDLLKRDIENYEKVKFHCEIIDEAQFIKNHTTQVSKSVKRIQASFKLALTGTPVENRLSELWSIFDYLMPGFLYGYQRFREELEIPIAQNQHEEALNHLQKMIRPFILRRLKKDVLTDLPDKLEENMYIRLEGEQLKLYDAHVQRIQMMLNKQSEEEFSGSRFQVLAELTKLRQLCCDPSLLFENYKENSAKSDMCMDLIQNAISGGHKVLLFSQFTTMLEHLQERMQKENIPFYSLTGATSKEKRARLVEEFNQNEIPVFCISLKAGGTGLNLTSADIVVHYDPWWNAAVQNQATDRAHRIGQTNVVTVYKLIAKGTIEENIVKLQDLKKELAEQVLGGGTLNMPGFTKEDLLALLD